MRSLGLAAMALMTGPPAPTPPAPEPKAEPAAKTDGGKPCEERRMLQPREPTPAQRHLPGLF